ncbi:hypothetical protein ACP70R_026641 [Stipagrostis hirtigluma subsp. patula]
MGADPRQDKQHVLPRHGGSSPPEQGGFRRKICIRYACGIFVFAVVVGSFSALFWYSEQSDMHPEYSVAITSVSGLDPAAAAGTRLLDPVFNLTVGIASHSVVRGGCIDPGTAIRVSYSSLRLPMASGRAPEMCVGKRPSSERRPAVATGHGVAVPGFVADSLAEDMRRGEAAFEVKLTSQEDQYEWKVVTCWVRVGDAAGSKTCTLSKVSND